VSLPEHHPYGRARGQFGELFLPHGDAPFPVAVVLHGGFWKAQYGRKQTHRICADLAARGWAAWNVEYRRLGRLSGGGYPATIDDVAAAVDHLADIPAHAAGALDRERVVAIGHSAGGHLAAWLATRKRPRVPVRGVVAQAGVVDLLMASELRLSNGIVHRLLGGTPSEVPERYTRASPAEHLPLGVPVLLTHGGRDDIVPAEMSERFATAARAAGDDVRLVVAPDSGHFGQLDPGHALWRAVTEWLDERC
jgi:dipeptidyl aminopeptidase/acylaminoacyl peptidase